MDKKFIELTLGAYYGDKMGTFNIDLIAFFYPAPREVNKTAIFLLGVDKPVVVNEPYDQVSKIISEAAKKI